jgi:RHS repeat-associated protein
VKKSAGSAGTLYWYAAPGIVAESNLSGTIQQEYVFFGGKRVARRSSVAPTGVFYYFSDHLNTASVITDSAGTIKAESDYFPWGGELQFVNSDSNHYKFTGKERDSETGLDYFGARYYSNGLGRFVTPDWAAKATAVPYAEFADPQSLNLYSYVRNRPKAIADADGHQDGCTKVSGGATCTITQTSDPQVSSKVYDNSGNLVSATVTQTTTTATYTFDAGGNITGGTQTTTTTSTTVDVNGPHESPTQTNTTVLSNQAAYKQAMSDFGGAKNLLNFQNSLAGAPPGFWQFVKKDAKEHPGAYAGRVAGAVVGAGCLVSGACEVAAGAAVGVKVMSTAGFAVGAISAAGDAYDSGVFGDSWRLAQSYWLQK